MKECNQARHASTVEACLQWAAGGGPEALGMRQWTLEGGSGSMVGK